MKRLNIFLCAILLAGAFYLSSCSTQKSASIEVDNMDGYTTKTIYNSDQTVEAIIITENDSSIVAVPLDNVSRARKMSDEEYKCLKKCKKPDGSYDTNCTLLCPVTKQYRVYFTYNQ